MKKEDVTLKFCEHIDNLSSVDALGEFLQQMRVSHGYEFTYDMVVEFFGIDGGNPVVDINLPTHDLIKHCFVFEQSVMGHSFWSDIVKHLMLLDIEK